MTATQGTIGYGSYIQIGDGASPETFNKIKEAVIIGAIGATRSRVDLTNLESPNAYNEFTHGMKDGSEFTVTFNWIDDAVQKAIRAQVEAGTRVNVKLQLSNSLSLFTFQADVFDWKLEQLEANTAKRGSFGFKITGPITET